MSSHGRPDPGMPEPPRRPRRLTIVDAAAHDEPEAVALPATTPPDPAAAVGTPPTPETDVASRPAPAQRGQPERGPLLAVCALCGGAGASTLSLLIAHYALGDYGAPVLACDTGGPAGGLAAYAHTEAPRSLPEVAQLVQDGLPAGQPFATSKDGLRVLATGPRLPQSDSCPQQGISTVLEQARTAHLLTVVDCGTLATASDQIALRAATHVAWVLPATRSAIARAARVLEAVNPHLLGRQLLIARRDHADTKAPTRDLKALAQRCGGPLILIPHLPDLHVSTKAAANAVDAAQVGLQAILGALTR